MVLSSRFIVHPMFTGRSRDECIECGTKDQFLESPSNLIILLYADALRVSSEMFVRFPVG